MSLLRLSRKPWKHHSNIYNNAPSCTNGKTRAHVGEIIWLFLVYLGSLVKASHNYDLFLRAVLPSLGCLHALTDPLVVATKGNSVQPNTTSAPLLPLYSHWLGVTLLASKPFCPYWLCCIIGCCPEALCRDCFLSKCIMNQSSNGLHFFFYS